MSDQPPEEGPERPENVPAIEEGEEEDALDLIPDELVEFVREAAGGDPERVTTLLSLIWTWQGPLPHPHALAAFNKAYDGCARDVVEMTRKQSDHRQVLESKVTDADIKLRQRGQHFGFIIAMTVIVGGIVIAALGKEWTGFAAVLLGLGGVVGLFVYSRHRQTEELDRKREALERSVRPDMSRDESQS